MADLDVKIKIMGERDASVDRAIAQTKKDFEEVNKAAESAGSALAPGGSGVPGAGGPSAPSNPAKSTEDNAKKQVQIIELALRREMALRQVGFKEQMSFLDRALVAAQGNGDEEVRILERIKQARDEAQQAGLQFAGGLATGLTATAAVLGLIGGRALQVSAEFEGMRAQLETVQGSAAAAAETFKSAVEFAAKTPFDVKGVVKATVQLEVYGQRSKEILPAVADLAAGMGKRLDDTSLVVGKALSGSLEGFESLRNEYGISSAELKKYGAVLNATGGISIRTSGDLDKAKAALLAIINLKFGGAIERQAQTLQGSLSNAADSIDVLFARIGDDLAPAAKLAATAFSGLVNGLSGFDENIRGAVVAGGLLTGILLGVGGASLGTVVALQALNIQIARVAGTSLAANAASKILTGSLWLMSVAGRAALAGLSWLVTTPLGLVITGIAVAAGALAATFATMEAEAKRAGDTISTNANRFQRSSNDLRGYRDMLNKVGAAHGVVVDTGRDIHQTGEQIRAAFAKIPAADLARSLQEAGEDGASLKKSLGEVGDQAGSVRKELIPLMGILQDLKEGKNDVNGKGELILDDPAKQAEINSLFGHTGVTVQEVTDRVQELQIEQRNLGAQTGIIQNLIQVWEKFVAPLDEGVAAAGRLNNFLKFATAAGDIQSLTTGLGELQNHLSTTAGEFAKLGISTDPGALQQRLLDPKIGDSERAAIESRLELLQEEEKLKEKITSRQLKDIDNTFQREHLNRDASLREEIANANQKLGIVQRGSDEETSLLKKRGDLEQQLNEKGNKRIEEAAKSRAKSIADSIDEIKNIAGSRSADLVAGYDVILDRLGKLKQLYKDATPEVKKFIDEQIRDTQQNRAQAQLQVPKENLQALNEVIDQMQTGGANTATQLKQVEAAITVVNSVRRKSDLDAEGTDKLLVQLGNQRLALEQQIAAQKLASAREIQGLELSAQDREIAFLEQRLAAGENVEAQLTKAREKRLEMALEAIETERQAELDGGNDKDNTNKKAELKRKAVLDEEVNRRLQGYQKETSGLAQHLNQRQSLLDSAAKNRDNRLGGAQSPLQSFGEAFGSGNGFNFSGVEQSQFGVGAFGGVKPRRVPTVDQVRRKVNEQVGKSNPKGDALTALTQGIGQANKTFNTTLNVDGTIGQLSDPDINKLVSRVMSKLEKRVDSRKQRRGADPGETFRQ